MFILQHYYPVALIYAGLKKEASEGVRLNISRNSLNFAQKSNSPDLERPKGKEAALK